MKCQNCLEEFQETAKESDLRSKISPTISGEKFLIPSPTLCPLCREQNRIAFRNERKLYKNKCAICDNEILSIYSPEKDYSATCSKCFWSDKNDPMSFGLDYDDKKSFFDQFDELLHRVNLLALFNGNVENSDYVNQEEDVKNCYLTVGGHFNESSLYTTYGVEGYKNMDCYFVFKSQYLYECTYCFSCNNCHYLNSCENCANCYLCTNCIGCTDCFGCENLNRKQYYYFNKPLEREEYLKKILEIKNNEEKFKEEKEKFEIFTKKQPKKYGQNKHDEDSSGDYLVNCKNIDNCFWVEDAQDCQNLYLAAYTKYCLDISSIAWAEFIYQCVGSTKINGSICCSQCISNPNSYYCSNCQNSHDLFGCIGLNHKQYCILNKQYTKEEYEERIALIIKNMIKADEWGKFFPMEISPFGYNETVAMEYFPIDESEAKQKGWKWQEKDFGIKYDGEFYTPKNISAYDPVSNPNAEHEIGSCLKGILKCEVSGRPFKVIPQELALCVESKIALPRRHPDIRHLERLSRFNPWRLYHRQCMNEGCSNEFDTTYSPDREEKVYCEKCYQEAVI